MAALPPLLLIATAASGVGTLISTYGAYQQAQAQQAQANYQAAIARNNAIAANQNADAIKARGEILEGEHRRKITQTKGAAKPVQAGNGFLVDDTEDSTNVQLIADIAELGELDILRIRDNTALEERRSRLQGANFQSQAGLFDAKAGSINPLMAGTSSLITGASSTVALGTRFGGTNKNSVFFTG